VLPIAPIQIQLEGSESISFHHHQRHVLARYNKTHSMATTKDKFGHILTGQIA
jgi:beta-xylosidase